jgi:hypothetical protein
LEYVEWNAESVATAGPLRILGAVRWGLIRMRISYQTPCFMILLDINLIVEFLDIVGLSPFLRVFELDKGVLWNEASSSKKAAGFL